MLTYPSSFAVSLALTIVILLILGRLSEKLVRSEMWIVISLTLGLILVLVAIWTNWPPSLFPQTSSLGLRASLILTILVLLPGGFLSAKWDRSRKRIFALGLVLILMMLTLWTDWPSDPFGRRVLWQNHGLVAGTLVSLLLLPSLYLFLDVSLEEARKARDIACIDKIKEGIQHDHGQFWAKYGDLGYNSSGKSLLEDLLDAREDSLAVQRTIAVWAQLTMHLQSREGMDMAKDAVRTFGALGRYIATLEQTTTLFKLRVGPGRPKGAALKDDEQEKLHAAHREVTNCYADLVEATGVESEIRKAERGGNPPLTG